LTEIGAHSKDGDSELVEVFFCVTNNSDRFYRFKPEVFGFGEEEKREDTPACEVFERDFFAFVGFEAERVGFGADFEAWNSFRLDLKGEKRDGLGRPVPTN